MWRALGPYLSTAHWASLSLPLGGIDSGCNMACWMRSLVLGRRRTGADTSEAMDERARSRSTMARRLTLVTQLSSSLLLLIADWEYSTFRTVGMPGRYPKPQPGKDHGEEAILPALPTPAQRTLDEPAVGRAVSAHRTSRYIGPRQKPPVGQFLIRLMPAPFRSNAPSTARPSGHRRNVAAASSCS